MVHVHKMRTKTFLRIRVSYSKALKDQEKDIGGMQPEANIKLYKDLNKEGLTTWRFDNMIKALNFIKFFQIFHITPKGTFQILNFYDYEIFLANTRTSQS